MSRRVAAALVAVALAWAAHALGDLATAKDQVFKALKIDPTENVARRISRRFFERDRAVT